MAENDAGIDLKFGPYGIHAWGRDAICIVNLLVLLGIGYLVFLENSKRSAEHANQVCINRLNIYVATVTVRTGAADSSNWNDLWSNMPMDLYQCVPKFLFDKPAKSRRDEN
jgi:hypothetical protein